MRLIDDGECEAMMRLLTGIIMIFPLIVFLDASMARLMDNFSELHISFVNGHGSMW